MLVSRQRTVPPRHFCFTNPLFTLGGQRPLWTESLSQFADYAPLEMACKTTLSRRPSSLGDS